MNPPQPTPERRCLRGADGGAGVQFTGNLVEHVTFFTNSDEFWATFTETGKIVGTDVGTGVTYTGRATAWGNFNMNERNQNHEFTLTLRATGTDGSSFTVHQTTVFVMNANGTVTVNFDKLNHLRLNPACAVSLPTRHRGWALLARRVSRHSNRRDNVAAGQFDRL